MPQKFLTAIDRQSEAWKKVTQHLEDRLQQLRESNDTDVGERETAKIRGRIAEVRSLLSENDLPSRDGEGIDYNNP